MKRYIKDGQIKTRNQIVIHKDGMNTYNPTEEMILAHGWIEYIPPIYDPTEEELLSEEKARKIAKIDDHDRSAAVNEFFYGDMSFWLPRETRVSVRSTAQILKDSGHQTMTLWLGDFNVTLAPEEVLQMLAVLEVYAFGCYNTTAKHKANVNALTDITDVIAYDFTMNYPEKIHF